MKPNKNTALIKLVEEQVKLIETLRIRNNALENELTIAETTIENLSKNLPWKV